jgi:hypothetical protein
VGMVGMRRRRRIGWDMLCGNGEKGRVYGIMTSCT